MPGQVPTFKHRAWGAERRIKVLLLFHRDRMPISQIATELGVSTRTVRNHIQHGLEANNEAITEIARAIRDRETERLSYVWEKLHESFEASTPKDAVKRARMAEAAVRLSERLSKLWGSDMPMKIQELQLQAQLAEPISCGPIRIFEMEPEFENDDSGSRFRLEEPIEPKSEDGGNGCGNGDSI